MTGCVRKSPYVGSRCFCYRLAKKNAPALQVPATVVCSCLVVILCWTNSWENRRYRSETGILCCCILTIWTQKSLKCLKTIGPIGKSELMPIVVGPFFSSYFYYECSVVHEIQIMFGRGAESYRTKHKTSFPHQTYTHHVGSNFNANCAIPCRVCWTNKSQFLAQIQTQIQFKFQPGMPTRPWQITFWKHTYCIFKNRLICFRNVIHIHECFE